MRERIICWPLNGGKKHIKNTLATAKKWPRPLHRGGHWIEVSNTAVYWQINRDFGKWPLNGGWLFEWHLSPFYVCAAVWFLIRRNIFQSRYMWEKSFSINLIRRVKIVILILKNCLVNHDRFKRPIFCLELKTAEKIWCPQKRIFKAARGESYLQLVYLEDKIEGWRSETLYSCRCGCKLGESKTDKPFTQHKHDKYYLQTKTQKPACETPGEFLAWRRTWSISWHLAPFVNQQKLLT